MRRFHVSNSLQPRRVLCSLLSTSCTVGSYLPIPRLTSLTHLFPSFSIPPNSTHSPRPLSRPLFLCCTLLYLTLIRNNTLPPPSSLSFVPFLFISISRICICIFLCCSSLSLVPIQARTSSRVLRLPRNLNALFQKKRDSNWSHCYQATSIVSGLCLLHLRLSNLHQVLVISRQLCCAVSFPMLGS